MGKSGTLLALCFMVFANLKLVRCANVTVFGDRLADDWEYWTWDSTTRETGASSSPVHSGTHALRIQYIKPHAGIALRLVTDHLETAQFRAVQFWAFGGPRGVNMKFEIYQDPTGTQRSKAVNLPLKFGSWTRFTVAMTVLGSPMSVVGLVWQDISGNPNNTHFYLDDIILVEAEGIPTDPCTSSPCINKGTCIKESATTYHCQCPAESFGPNCEEINACLSDPCQNGAICTPQAGNKYSCLCRSGFTGSRCENEPVHASIGSSCPHGVDFARYPGHYYNGQFLDQSQTIMTLEDCAIWCATTHDCLSANYKEAVQLCALYATKSTPQQTIRSLFSESSQRDHVLDPRLVMSHRRGTQHHQSDWNYGDRTHMRWARQVGSWWEQRQTPDTFSPDYDYGPVPTYEKSTPGEDDGLTPATSVENSEINESPVFDIDERSIYVFHPKCNPAPQTGLPQPPAYQALTTTAEPDAQEPDGHSHLQALLSRLDNKQIVAALQQLDKAQLSNAPTMPNLTCSSSVEFRTVPNAIFYGLLLGEYRTANMQECAEKCFSQPLCRSANYRINKQCETMAEGQTDFESDPTMFSKNNPTSTHLQNISCPSNSRNQDQQFFDMLLPFIQWLLRAVSLTQVLEPVHPSASLGLAKPQPHQQPFNVFPYATPSPFGLPTDESQNECGRSAIAPSLIAARYRVIVGGHTKRANPNDGAVVAQVVRIFVHPNYQDTTVNSNDVAVLLLDRPMQLSRAIALACLAENEFRDHTECVVTGWGATEGTADDALLNQVVVPLIPRSICNDAQHYNQRIDETMLCAGYEQGGRDSCQGDSGGPLVCRIGKRWVQAGVVSWGKGCAEQFKPGVYANIAHLRRWIIAQLR